MYEDASAPVATTAAKAVTAPRPNTCTPRARYRGAKAWSTADSSQYATARDDQMGSRTALKNECSWVEGGVGVVVFVDGRVFE
jgi:hypothetical protein